MLDDLSDSDLLARIAQKDMRAMALFYKRHAGAVSAFVARYVSDQAEVSDIVQVAMMTVWRKAGSFEGRAKPRTWLLALARNKAVDHLRKTGRAAPVDPASQVLDQIDPQNAESIVAAAQDHARLRACVDSLPQAQRTVVHLAFFQEASYPEVAEIEGIALGTVKTRIYHAKKLLMHCLQQAGIRADG